MQERRKNRPKGKVQAGPGVPCKKKDQKVRSKQDLESPAKHLPIKSVKIIRNAYKCVQDRPVLIIMLVLNKTETKHKETNAAQHGSSFATFYKKNDGVWRCSSVTDFLTAVTRLFS